MAKYDLSFSPEELAALRAMTEDEMLKAAESDPDARPMSEEMLARAEPGRRLERGKAARIASARRLADEARAARGEVVDERDTAAVFERG